MKILQLIDSLNPGGAERMCVNISNALYDKGVYVKICTSRRGGSLSKEVNTQIPILTLNKRWSGDIIAFLRLLKLLRNERFDLIHAHSTSIFWAVAAKYFTRKVKVLWHDHLGLKVNQRKGKFFYRIISLRIDGIIVVNKNLEEWAKTNLKVPHDKIVCLNNFSRFKIIKKKGDTKNFTIVYLANIRPQKDHKTLFYAIKSVLSYDLPNPVKVILAGRFTYDDYYLKLKKLSKDLNLDSFIQFAGPVTDVQTLIENADCGVLSSVSEGLPVSLIEYGIAALPVIVTNVGQCPEVVGHGEFGKIVEPGDPEAIARELLWMINNRKEAEKMGEAFKEHIDNNYGQWNFLSAYCTLLNEIFKTQ